MLKPNFFIVGAPKSGTTALYNYLKQHPQVYIPKKEICFFSPDLLFRTPHLSEAVYLSYYAGATGQKAVGDGFIFHLLSECAAQEIKKFNPEANIIMILRNPVQMVYSFHSQLVFNGDEPIEDFEKALDAETSRREGKLIPPYYRCPLQAFFYSSVAKYYEQVLRYKSVFPEHKVHIVFFEDFKADTEKEYRNLLKFLALDEIIPDSFDVINSNKALRSRTYLQFLMSPPGFIKVFGRFFFPHHSKRRAWLMKKLWNFNAKKKPRPQLTDALKQRLVNIYKDDIEKLGKLLNRDLSNWTKV